MKKLFLSAFTGLLLSTPSFSQIAEDFMIGTHMDLIRSDHDGYFEKVQVSASVDYFFSDKFTANAGAEYWSRNNKPSLVLGTRWYPIPDAFIRLRGLIGVNHVSIGGGWAKPLTENLKFEAIGDIYTNGYIAIRAGLVCIIKK
jgi:hypothetical protein